MALCALNNLDEQRQLLSSIEGFCSHMRESATLVQSLQGQVAAHSVELSSACGDTLRLEESVVVAHCRLADVQSASRTVKGECNEYQHRLRVEEHHSGGLEALLPGLCSRLVDHMSLPYLVCCVLLHTMEHDLDVYLQAIFASMRDHTDDFSSATSNVIDTHIAKHHQDDSSIFMDLDGRVAALGSEALVATSSGR